MKRILRAIAAFYTEGHAQPSAPPPVEAVQVEPAAQGARIPPARIPPDTPPFNGEPIPKYPDHGIAVPAAPPESIIQSQRDLIAEMQQACGLSHTDFRDVVMPVIHNYACFVHLLPASEAHHHCAQGGMFRHGLEVAFYAARKCEAKVFALDFPPSLRKHLEPRWVVAAMLGGLMHDLGKPQVDMGAVNGDGTLTWDPYRESLYAWLARNHIEYYYISWRSGLRHKRHEARTLFAVDRLMPQSTRNWLSEYNGETAVNAMLDALGGSTDIRNPMIAIIKGSDSESVARDIKDSRMRLGAAGTGGVRSLAARAVRAMHDQIAGGDWKLNTPGSPVWITDEGVFAAYPAACVRAIELLREQGDTGLPNDASNMAEVLREQGYLVENTLEEGGVYNTWHGDLHLVMNGREHLQVFHGIRFAQDIVIPNSIVLPQPVRIDLKNAKGEILNPEKETKEPEVVEETPHEEFAAKLAPAPPKASVPQSPEGDEAAFYAEQKTSKDTKAKTQPASAEPVAPGVQVASLPPPDMDDDSVPTQPTQPTQPAPAPLRDRRSEPEVREALMEASRAAAANKWPPETAEAAAKWFESQGVAGEWLVAIADQVRGGTLVMDRDIIVNETHIHLRYPEALDTLAVPAVEAGRSFNTQGWTERDPATPNRGVVSLQRGEATLNALRLTERISAAFRKLLPMDGATGERKRQPAFPFGPFMDGRVAAVILSRRTMVPADRPHFVLAFDEFYTREMAREGSSAATSPEAIDKYIEQFATEHDVGRRALREHLTTTNNPYFIRAKEATGAGKSKSVLCRNPSYDRSPDEITAAARLAQAERGRE